MKLIKGMLYALITIHWLKSAICMINMDHSVLRIFVYQLRHGVLVEVSFTHFEDILGQLVVSFYILALHPLCSLHHSMALSDSGHWTPWNVCTGNIIKIIISAFNYVNNYFIIWTIMSTSSEDKSVSVTGPTTHWL